MGMGGWLAVLFFDRINRIGRIFGEGIFNTEARRHRGTERGDGVGRLARVGQLQGARRIWYNVRTERETVRVASTRRSGGAHPALRSALFISSFPVGSE